MAQKFTITAQLNLQAKNVNQVISQLQKQFQGANLNINVRQIQQASTALQNVSKNAGTASSSMSNLGKNIADAAKRFSALTIATGTFVGLARAIKHSVSDAIAFDREMIKIAQATDSSVSSLKSLSQEIGSVSSSLGVSSKELVLAARNLTQAGFAANKVKDTLKILAQTELAATFDSIADTTEGVIAVLNQFGRAAQQNGSEVKFLENALSAINQVSKEFAVESGDLITAIRTTGSAFETAGGSLNELIALFTSVRSTTRESAESISTGFRTIFTRLQRVDTINKLRELGIELQDVDGKFIGPLESVKRLSTALKTIDPRDYRFNVIVEELGGFRQVSKVIPLIQQFTGAQQALNVAQNSSGSLAKDAASAQQALAVQIAKVREEFQTLIRDIVGSSAFQSFARGALELASAFIKVADALRPALPLLTSFAALKLGQIALPAVSKFFAGKKAQGGKILGFASGGLVPGQGNGDTVPAMLSPGEFVIKKSSVKSLGANNLAKMNGYADGGRVTFFPKSGLYGAFALQPEGEADSSLVGQTKVTNTDASKGLFNIAKKRFKKLKDEDQPNTDMAVAADSRYEVPAFYIGNGDGANSKQMREAIANQTKQGFQSIIQGVASDPSFQLGSPPLAINENYLNSAMSELFSSKSNAARTVIEGYVLEGVTSALGEIKLGGGQETWDMSGGFESSAQKLARIYGEEDKIKKLKSADAKRSLSADARANILGGKLAKSLIASPGDIGDAVFSEGLTSLETEKSKATESKNKAIEQALSKATAFRNKMIDAYGGQTLQFASPGEGKPPVASYQLDSPGGLVSSLVGNGKFSLSKTAAKYDLDETDENKVLNTLKMWKKNPPTQRVNFADGGPSGTDTVPAMLTPGEYVINKASAQKIGYGALNKMNKVGKFAAGGVVGMAQGGQFDPQQQQMQKSMFMGQFSSMIKPGQAQKISKMLDEMIKAGLDAEAAMRAIAREIVKKKGGFKTDKGLEERAQNAATQGGKLSPAAAGGKGAEDASEKLKSLAFIATALGSEFSGLDNTVTKTITSFAVLYPVVKQIGQDIGSNITKFGKGLSESSKSFAGIKVSSVGTQLQKFGAGVEAGAQTVALLTSAAQAVSVVFDDLASKQEAVVGQEIKKVQNTGMGDKGRLLAASRRQENYNIGSQVAGKFSGSYAKTFGMIGAGVGGVLGATGGGVAGAAAGTAVAPVAGTAAGGAAGAAVGGAKGSIAGGAIGVALGAALDSLVNPINITKRSFEDMDGALFDSEASIYKFNKILENLDKIKTPELQKAATTKATDLGKTESMINDILSQNYGKEPTDDATKKKLENLRESAGKAAQQMQRLASETQTRAIKSMEAMARAGNKVDFSKVTKNLEDQIKGKFKERIEKSGTQAEKQLVTSEMNAELAAMQTAMKENEAQIYRQLAAEKLESETRIKLIGTLNEEKAQRMALAKYSMGNKQAEGNLQRIKSVTGGGGSLEGFQNTDALATSLSLDQPTREMTAALETLTATFGVNGKEVGNKLKDFQVVTAGMDTALSSLQQAMTSGGEGMDKKGIDKFLKSYFDKLGAGGSDVVDILSNFVQGQLTAGGESSGALNDEMKDRIIKMFGDSKEQFAAKFQELIKALGEYEQNIGAVFQEYSESVQKGIDLQVQNIDGLRKSREIMAQATGKKMSLEEKQSFTNAKVSATAGGRDINVQSLGKELFGAQAEMKAMGDQRAAGGGPKNEVQAKAYQANLTKQNMTIKQTTEALKLLANQSERTSDIMNELEDIRGKKKSFNDLGERFVFGSNEERMGINQSLGAAQAAAQTGNINAVPEDQRGQVLQLFDQFKDVKAFGGKTGAEAKKEVMAQGYREQGMSEDAIKAFLEQSSPEEKLIKELEHVAQEEAAARMLLAQSITSEQQLIDAIGKLDQNFATFKADLLTNKTALDQAKPAAAAALKEQGIAAAPVQTAAQLQESAKKAEADAKSKKVEEENRRQIAAVRAADRNAELEDASSMWYSKGGIVYRAGGGSIFKPKGTDTVPAMLTPGEFVMSKSAVNNIGASNLSAMNHLAKGGFVNYLARGGIAQFQQKQLQRQKAVRQNSMSNQFAQRSSYMNMTRLSPKQKKMQREQQMSGGGAQEGLGQFMESGYRNNFGGQTSGGQGAANAIVSAGGNGKIPDIRPTANSAGSNRIANGLSSEFSNVNRTAQLSGNGVSNASIANANNLGSNSQASAGSNMNMDAFKDVTSKLNEFVVSMQELSKNLNGMSMSHTVTVDGQLNIGGFNSKTIADAIRTEVTNLVMEEVKKGTKVDSAKTATRVV